MKSTMNTPHRMNALLHNFLFPVFSSDLTVERFCETVIRFPSVNMLLKGLSCPPFWSELAPVS